MLDKGVQGVVGNFVLKTDPLPVCLCGFYVTTLCMEQFSALLFCGILKVFLHTFKKTHPSTLILHLLIPFHLSFYWTPTLKHWQIYMRNQVTFAAFHAFMKQELYLILVPALIYCWNVQSHVRI